MSKKRYLEYLEISLTPAYGTAGGNNNSVYLELKTTHLRQILHLGFLCIDKRTNNQYNPNSYTQNYLNQ